jgi:hypothetical protein
VLSLLSARTRFPHTVHIHFLIGIVDSSADAHPHKWTNLGLNKREAIPIVRPQRRHPNRISYSQRLYARRQSWFPSRPPNPERIHLRGSTAIFTRHADGGDVCAQ